MGEEVFVDSNVFLALFLDEGNANDCEEFLISLSERNKIPVTTDFVMYSCFVIVERNLKNIESLKKAFMFFANYQNLRIIRLAFEDVSSAIEIMENNKLDFDDSLVVACMKNYGIRELASFDRHFDKVKGIERVRI